MKSMCWRETPTISGDRKRGYRGSVYLPMNGRIVVATLIEAPRQRNTETDKAAITDAPIRPNYSQTTQIGRVNRGVQSST